MGGLADQLIEKKFAVPQKDSALFMVAIEFFKKGGGMVRAREVLDLAYGRVNPREVLDVLSPSLQDAGGKDQSSDVKRQSSIVHPRAPLNVGSDAALDVKNKLAQSVLDTVHTSDGRAWGDVGAHELDGMERDGALAVGLKRHLGTLTNAQRFKPIRELVSPATFETIRKQAHGS